MQTIAFILPNGTPIQAEGVKDFQEKALSIAGGYSRYEGMGVWLGSESSISEPHARIEVLISSEKAVDLMAAFVEYGRNAGECVLYYVTDGRGCFISVSADAEREVAQ